MTPSRRPACRLSNSARIRSSGARGHAMQWGCRHGRRVQDAPHGLCEPSFDAARSVGPAGSCRAERVRPPGRRDWPGGRGKATNRTLADVRVERGGFSPLHRRCHPTRWPLLKQVDEAEVTKPRLDEARTSKVKSRGKGTRSAVPVLARPFCRFPIRWQDRRRRRPRRNARPPPRSRPGSPSPWRSGTGPAEGAIPAWRTERLGL